MTPEISQTPNSRPPSSRSDPLSHSEIDKLQSENPTLATLMQYLDSRWTRTDSQQEHKENLTIELRLELAKELFTVVGKLLEKLPEIEQLHRFYDKKIALNHEQHEKRINSNLQNRAAKVIDGIIREVGQDIKTTTNLFSLLQDYKLWYRENNIADIVSSKLVDEKDNQVNLIEEIKTNINGVCQIIDLLHEQLESFPVRTRELAKTVMSQMQNIELLFDPESLQKNKFLQFLFGGSEEDDDAKSPYCLYKNNPQLTCFLNETLSQISTYIPVKDRKNEDISTPPQFKANDDFKTISRYMRLHSDGKLLAALRVGKKLSREIVEYYGGSYKLNLEVFNQLQSSSVKELRAKIEEVNGNHTENSIYLEKFKEGISGKKERLTDFDLTTTLVELTSFSRNKVNKKTLGQSTGSNEAREFRALLAEIESLYEELKLKHVSYPENELFSRLYSIAYRKKSIDRDGEKKLSLDTEQDNFCYSAIDDGGGLKLVRAATPRVSYKELRGASWVEVQQKMQLLTRYSKLSKLYTEMTPRRKVNSNLLLIGPYGCGKNEYTRALMSDKNIVGINMTTERLLTKWFGEAESNVRRLFDGALKLRKKHDKPVVIAWDEFDSLFSQGRDGGCSDILTRIQKAVQAVLDGDTVYEGVTLVGMTNEPNHIPVPVYRRFSYVQIIEALTGEERIDLLKSYLQSLPLSEDLDRVFNWTDFAEKTQNMSGDMIGKIFDSLFKSYIENLEVNFSSDVLEKIDKAAGEIVDKHGSIRASQREKIFRDATGGKLLITAFDLNQSVWDILKRDDIKSGIVQQKNFYGRVRERLAEAFKNDI